MNELPAGWVVAHLEDLAAPEPRAMTDGPFGSNLKTEHYTDDGPRVIRLQNVGFGEFIDERAHISEEHFELLRAYEARAGDLIVASLGQDLPKSCLVPATATPAIVKADCIRVRLHADVDGRFVNYALQRPGLKRLVEASIHGVGRPRLGMAGVRKLEVPLAPRAEQARIVAAIDAHLSRLDAAERSIARAAKGSARLRAALIEHAVGGSWSRVPLGDLLLTLRNGCFVSRPKAGPPGLPIYRISAVRALVLDVNDVRYAPADLNGASDYAVEAGDLLFTRYSGNPAYVGACAVVPKAGAGILHPDKLIRGIVDVDRVLPEWIALATASSLGRKEIEDRLKTTAGQVGIAGGQLKSVAIPLPSLEEQRGRIAAWSKASVEVSRLQDELAIESNLRAGRLRRSILAAAFSGMLAARDSQDEPASVLLESIRAQRAAQPKRRRAAS